MSEQQQREQDGSGDGGWGERVFALSHSFFPLSPYWNTAHLRPFSWRRRRKMMSVPGDPSLSFLLLLLFGHLAHSLLCIVYFGGSFLDPGFSSCARKGKQSTPDPFSLFLSRREAILSSSAGRTILPPQQQGRDFFAPLQISFLAPPAFSICSVLFLLARKKRNTESGIYGKSRSEKNKRLSLTPRPTTNRAGGKSPTSVAFPFHVPKQRKLLCVLSPPKKVR